MSRASSLERMMLGLVNEERASAGLDPLRLELRLNDSSEAHSEWMLRADAFSHTGAGGSDAGERMRDAGFAFSGSWSWAENIALQSERGEAGLADDVADLHRSLMKSPGHRANLLDPDFEVVGIGVERGEYRGFDAVVVTQNFARSGAPMQFDGGAAGGAPTPAPTPAPDPNAAPVARMDDLRLDVGERVSIEDLVRYSDADGDAAQRFEVKLMGGGAKLRIDGEVVSARDGEVFAASDLDEVEIEGAAGAGRSMLRIRASDGEDWGRWDGFRVHTEAPARGSEAAPAASGGKPVVEVDDIVIAPGLSASVAEATRLVAGEVEAVQVFDGRGGQSFHFAGGPAIDASKGVWIAAEDFDDLMVRGDDREGSQSLRLRVSDGEEVSDWDRFVVTSSDDWDGLA